MLFSELLANDKFKAFDYYVTVESAKLFEIIPNGYESIFSDTCVVECGSERIIRKNATEVMCCNPRCPVKLSYYLHKMLSSTSVSGIGPELCKKAFMAMYKRGVRSHVDFILHPDLTPAYHALGQVEGYRLIDAIKEIKNNIYTFSNLFKLSAIPEFDSTSEQLFGEIKNMGDLAEKLKDEGGLRVFAARRGIHDSMKLFYFAEFYEDIIRLEEVLIKNIIPPSEYKVQIVMTGSQRFRGNKISKDEFIAMCNVAGFTSDGYRLISVIRNEAVHSVDFIISEKDNQASKANVGRQREASNPGKKVLYTCDEFYDYLVEAVKRAEEGAKVGESE